jgi:hypothetical protein
VTTQFELANTNNTSSDSKFYRRELEERLQATLPVCFILSCSLLVILLSAALIFFERSQSDRFQLDDLRVLSYRTLNGLCLLASSVNMLYSLAAIVSVVVLRNYFLTQLVAILFLIGSLMSFVYLIIFNIVVLIFSILSSPDCSYACILMRSFSILFGVVITIVEVSFFMLIQINYLTRLNSAQQQEVRPPSPSQPITRASTPSPPPPHSDLFAVFN